MASLGHVFVGMAAARVVEPGAPPRRIAAWMVGMSALSLAPDLDVVSFALGVPYGAPWGHRGATHSPAFAALVAVAVAGVALVARWPARRAAWLFVCAFVVVASHGVLDALTDGGKGVAFAWPFGARRYFLPWRPIPVAPIGGAVLGARGRAVMLAECVYFAPFAIGALVPWRRLSGRRR